LIDPYLKVQLPLSSARYSTRVGSTSTCTRYTISSYQSVLRYTPYFVYLALSSEYADFSSRQSYYYFLARHLYLYFKILPFILFNTIRATGTTCITGTRTGSIIMTRSFQYFVSYNMLVYKYRSATITKSHFCAKREPKLKHFLL
jgi:hypothetical protein